MVTSNCLRTVSLTGCGPNNIVISGQKLGWKICSRRNLSPERHDTEFASQAASV
jgi:hypothetical protein